MHPLNSVKGAITTGVVLAIIIGIALACWMSNTAGFHAASFDRWLHIMSGVMWIGLLYYFNVVQTPGLAAAAADKGGPGGAGITKYVAPRALSGSAGRLSPRGSRALSTSRLPTARTRSSPPSRCSRAFASSASAPGSEPSC